MRTKCTYTLPSGEEVELYPISRLAEALGRGSLTIRQWEIGGILPSTCFRSTMGDRLYTKEQIEVIVKAAEKYKLKKGMRTPKGFVDSTFKAFKELEEKYKGGVMNDKTKHQKGRSLPKRYPNARKQLHRREEDT